MPSTYKKNRHLPKLQKKTCFPFVNAASIVCLQNKLDRHVETFMENYRILINSGKHSYLLYLFISPVSTFLNDVSKLDELISVDPIHYSLFRSIT